MCDPLSVVKSALLGCPEWPVWCCTCTIPLHLSLPLSWPLLPTSLTTLLTSTQSVGYIIPKGLHSLLLYTTYMYEYPLEYPSVSTTGYTCLLRERIDEACLCAIWFHYVCLFYFLIKFDKRFKPIIMFCCRVLSCVHTHVHVLYIQVHRTLLSDIN